MILPLNPFTANLHECSFLVYVFPAAEHEEQRQQHHGDHQRRRGRHRHRRGPCPTCHCSCTPFFLLLFTKLVASSLKTRWMDKTVWEFDWFSVKYLYWEFQLISWVAFKFYGMNGKGLNFVVEIMI